ncbi:hypothetical protein Q8G37_26645 [Bacillus wiedmannii]|uniref:hypothetical protein n=1 Tax=Bacillus wiedmannii TaxID=1890302 RepID=UPI002730FA35|nr:hypothetical protein [Bacillus wiedmannii]MDP1459952.1 hypothetical protein [Bacillus wiedmannii]
MNLTSKYNKTILLLFGLTTIAVMFAISIKGNSTFDVSAILREFGIINPPNWLVWSILTAGSAAFVVSVLASAGMVTVPAAAIPALLGADGAFA